MKVNPEQATETMIKFLIYLNLVFIIALYFVKDSRGFCMFIVIFNIIFLLLRQGIKKESNNIMYRGSQ